MRFLFPLILILSLACSPSDPMPAPQKNIHYLALGDSYTIGESVAASERWPVQLAQGLRNEKRQVETQIIARTGWTSDELETNLEAINPKGTYDMVSLLIGVNNQYRRMDTTSYRASFIRLIEKSIALAGGNAQRVFVLSIPDWGLTPFGKQSGRTTISQEIDAFNQVKKSVCAAYGITFFDITPISRLAQDQPDLIAQDGLHPSGKMYQAWVETIIPPLLSKF